MQPETISIVLFYDRPTDQQPHIILYTFNGINGLHVSAACTSYYIL